MLARCPSCDSKLKVPDAAAGKRVRCPICEKSITIPQPAGVSQDSVSESQPRSQTQSPVRPTPKEAPSRTVAKPPPAVAKPRPAAAAPKLDDDLEIVEVLRVKDPVADRPKPKKKRRIVRKVEQAPPGAGADMLVWLFLLAFVPLVLHVFFPGEPLEERVRKTVEQNEEMKLLLEDQEGGGARAVLFADPNLTLVGAHLSRNSKMHWVYALLTTVIALIVLGIMLVRSTVSAVHLLFTGIFTGTFGILMLLAFQFIAQVSLVGGGFLMGGGILGFIIKFIGFSYICAMMPGNGFLLSFMGFTCGVGFCEEFCKAWPIKYYLSHADKSEWRGTFLVGVASGFGFGISEGIMYAGAYYNGIEPGLTYLVRFASCVAFHGLLSGSVALLMFGNQDLLDSEPGWIAFFLNWGYYIGIAMIMHGLYDTLLKQDLEIGALVVALATFGWTFWLARYYWSYDPEPAPA